ncbi:MAG TPA: hypothetical protein VGJ38_08020 [Jatrophihabitantaceae bacterium]
MPGNLPLGDQIAQAERTGLAFTPLTDHRTYDQHWDPQWTSDKLLLVPGEEANGSPHAIVLGATDTVVDGANPPGSAAFRHVQQSIWDAHAQDAIWSTAHPDSGEYTPLDGPNDNASAQGMNTVEVYNVASNPDAEVDYAENRWNRGFRFGVSSASDCHFREVWDIAGPGLPTTWVPASAAEPGPGRRSSRRLVRHPLERLAVEGTHRALRSRLDHAAAADHSRQRHVPVARRRIRRVHQRPRRDPHPARPDPAGVPASTLTRRDAPAGHDARVGDSPSGRCSRAHIAADVRSFTPIRRNTLAE